MLTIYEQCLERNIYVPRIFDEYIIIYLKLGSGVLLCDEKYAYVFVLNKDCAKINFNLYKLNIIMSQYLQLMNNYPEHSTGLVYKNMFVRYKSININQLKKLEHAINLNMFK